MAAMSQSRGHVIRHTPAGWVYEDNGRPAFGGRLCARCGKSLTREGLDACIRDVVRALNAGGLVTVSSCCGHGIEDGFVKLADGRVLRLDRKE